MIRFLLYVLLAWFLYKVIFKFIIPVYKTTRLMKKKFREMHDHAQDQQLKQKGYKQPGAGEKVRSEAPRSDYIDFEEIK